MLIKVTKFTIKFKIFDFHYPHISFCNFQNSVSEKNVALLNFCVYISFSEYNLFLEVNCIFWVKLHSHQTADQPPINADEFLWLGRVWSGKKLPALVEERIYPRSTPAVSALYSWCTHAQIPLFPTYPRSSGWPIPAQNDQPPTYSWYNYAHYAQYRANARSDFHSRLQMNNSSKC